VLNLRQRTWLELSKDYYLSIQYHPGKADVVAYALSRTGVPKTCMYVLDDLDRIGISLCYAGAHEETRLLIQLPLCELLRVAQLQDHFLQVVLKRIEVGKPREFSMEEDGTIFSEVAFVYHRKPQ